MNLKQALPLLKKGMEIRYKSDNTHGVETGVIDYIDYKDMEQPLRITDGDGNKFWKLSKGIRDIGIVKDENGISFKGKRGRPRTKAPKVNFLLKYDLDEDPIEEFETIEQVKDRIDYLVKNERSLKKDSIIVYEVKRKKVVSIETKITMK
jgi:hypothetical protein